MASTVHDSVGFSVVIPSFNREALVLDAVESALSQTAAPGEIIVVDDGSTDGTEAVLSPYQERVRYIRQENAGVSAARNRGVREANGAWVAFLDSDDVWEPDRLQWIDACIEQAPGSDWLITDSTLVQSDLSRWPGDQGFSRGFEVFQDVQTEPTDFFSEHLATLRIQVGAEEAVGYVGDAFPLLVQGNFVQPSALVVRREVLEEMHGFDEDRRLAEETDLALRLAVRHELLVLMRPLVRWRVGEHESLISPDNIETLIENTIDSIEEVSAIRPLQGEAAKARDEQLARLWRKLAYTQLSNLRAREARSTLRTARTKGISSLPEGRLLWLATWIPTKPLRVLRSLKSRMR